MTSAGITMKDIAFSLQKVVTNAAIKVNLIINDAIRKIASLSQTVVIGILKPNENEGGNRYDQAGKR